MEHSDGIDEELAALVRMAVAQATLLLEQIARVRERQARIDEAQAAQRSAEDQRRIDAELAAMRAQVQPVLRDDWWKHATPERIGTTYETAAAFEPYDTVARQAAERIRDQVRERYGVAVDTLAREAHGARTARETAVGKALDDMTPDERRVSYLDAQRALAAADPELSERIGLQVLEARTEAESITAQNEAIEARRRLLTAQSADQHGPQKVPLAEAELAAAAAADRTAVEHAARVDARVTQMHHQADSARATRIIEELKIDVDQALAEYDNPRRRDRVQASLQATGTDADAVEGRMLDDISNALPPSAAVSRRRHPRARTTRPGQGAARDLEHGR
ncbi:hypothetical protein E0H75_42380 [Kribbella capetownensis]|uniref:Uncharacterized protein n=1 Tax=Kribbella capetownensis TaxID=1572659 RepID=A0A4R0INH9_9ACTN|nr:hypothetical protein [Kribbella capetownensis]TCC33904.1 hypothetical protein E0H75_42380 [Kribbella capetownensis]